MLYNKYMKISDFVKESKDAKLEYAVLRNWRQPTPQWDEFQNLYDHDFEQGRIFIKIGRILILWEIF